MNGRRRHQLTRLAVAGLVVLTAASCSSDNNASREPTSASSAAAATGHATIGSLTITGGYIPQPASPDVAAAYLTITNTGASPDTITKITTNVTTTVMAMTETDHNGVGTMTDLHSVTITAHGHVSFIPSRAHLMLLKPTSRLRTGQHIEVTITFDHAGTVTVAFPVVPLPTTGPMPSTSPMG